MTHIFSMLYWHKCTKVKIASSNWMHVSRSATANVPIFFDLKQTKRKKNLSVPCESSTSSHWPRHRILCVLRCIIVTPNIKCRSRMVWNLLGINQAPLFYFYSIKKKSPYIHAIINWFGSFSCVFFISFVLFPIFVGHYMNTVISWWIFFTYLF